MKREETVALLRAKLTEYVTVKPQHSNGLCWWLLQHCQLPELGRAPMTVKPNSSWNDRGTSFHVDRESGPSPVRLEFAQHLLDLLDAGKLVPALGPSNPWILCRHRAAAEATLKLIDVLREYIAYRPQHHHGLCSYVMGEDLDVYDLCSQLLKGPLRWRYMYFGRGYVDEVTGPTDTRVLFAEDVLDRLVYGKAELLSSFGACRVD